MFSLYMARQSGTAVGCELEHWYLPSTMDIGLAYGWKFDHTGKVLGFFYSEL